MALDDPLGLESSNSQVMDDPLGIDGGLPPETVASLNREAQLTAGGRQTGEGNDRLLAAIGQSFIPKDPTPQEIKQQQLEKAAGVEPIPVGLRIASGLDTGIRQGMNTPAKLVHGAADLAMGAVGAGNTRLGRWNADMLKQYAAYEAEMNARDAATFGENDIASQLASGTGRAITELPLYLIPGGGAAGAEQAVARSAAAAGIVGGGTQYAQDRAEGRGRLDAATYATASGLITALTTRAFGATGAESVFRNEGIQGIRNRILAVLKDAGMEGAEEISDQIQQDILERYSRNPDKPIDATLKEVLMAGAIGGIVGGGVAAGKEGFEAAGGAARKVAQAVRQAAQFPGFESDMVGTALPQTAPEAKSGNIPVEQINQELAKANNQNTLADDPLGIETSPAVPNLETPAADVPRNTADVTDQVRRELESLPGAEQDLKPADPIAAKIDNLAAAVADLQATIKGNQIAPEQTAPVKAGENNEQTQRQGQGQEVLTSPAAQLSAPKVSSTVQTADPAPAPPAESAASTKPAEKYDPYKAAEEHNRSLQREQPAQSQTDTVETILRKYDEGDDNLSTPRDVAAAVQGLIDQGKAPESLQKHIDTFNQAVEESRSQYGERMGVEEDAADQLMTALRGDGQTFKVGDKVIHQGEVKTVTRAVPGSEFIGVGGRAVRRSEVKPLTESGQSGTKESAASATSTVRTADNLSNERQRGRVPGNPGMTAEEGSNPSLDAAAISTAPAPSGAGTPKRSKFRSTDRPYDIIDAAEEHVGGKISWKLIKEANPDWKPTGAARKIFAAKGEPADTAAQTLADLGIYKGDPGQVDQFGDAMNAAATKRIGARKQAKTEKSVMAEEIAQNQKFHKDIKQESKRTEPIVANDLNEGDEFTLKGAKFRVVSFGFDGDGNITSVTLDDGKQYGTQVVDGDTVLRMDKGSLDRADNTPFAAGDLEFDAPESVDEQKARMAREKQQAQQREAKDSMMNRASARLTSNEDTRTQDMFGGAEHRTTRQDKGGQGSLFSEGKPVVRGLPREQIQRIASALAKEMPKALPVTVVATPDELPTSIRSNADRQGVRLNGVKGTVVQGRVYLVAKNLETPQEARSIWLHEQVGHFATDATLGKELRSFMEQVATSFENSSVMAEVRRRYPKADKFTLGREVVARIAENPQAEPNLWRRVVAMVRAWLRKSGWVREVTDNDVRAVLSRAANALRGGESATGRQVEQPAMASGKQSASYIIGQVNNAKELGDTDFEIVERRADASSRDAGKRMFEVVGKKSGNGYFRSPTREQAESRAAQMRAVLNPSLAGSAPLWRSNIQDALETWQGKGTREQLMAHLQKTRGAMDEAEWIGLTEWLKDKPTLTKQQVAEFVRANQVDVQEVSRDQGGTAARERLEDLNNRMAHELPQLAWQNGFNQVQAANLPWHLREGRIKVSELPEAMQEEAQKFLDASREWESEKNKPQPKEPKFANYQLPGGENYRELLLTLPEKSGAVVGPKGWGDTSGGTSDTKNFRSSHFDEPNILAHVRFNERTDADGKRVLHLEEVQSDWHQKGRKSGYTNEAEYEKNGKRANELFPQVNATLEKLDRLGFDRLEEARREVLDNPEFATMWDIPAEDVPLLKEYRETVAARKAARNPETVPDAPFKQTWPMLAMKRMIRYAADNGFDRITWTTGEQQAARYDLSKQISSLRVFHAKDGTYDLSADVNGRGMVDMASRIKGNQIEDYVGKEMAAKILSGEQEPSRVSEAVEGGDGVWKTYSGLDLKVGGDGMKGFYDRILPAEVNKFVKKWGGKVGQSRVEIGGDTKAMTGAIDGQSYESIPAYRPKQFTPVHSLDITPAMKDAAMQGMPMFAADESNSEMSRLQDEIAAAEQELKDAIRMTVLPPDMRSMNKMDALKARDEAHSKLRRLLAEQLKLMTSVNVDAARSPQETSDLISQTVDLLNSIQDEISERNAKSQEIPADLTKLRQDLQTRLNLLKGWTDNQTEAEAQGGTVPKDAKRDSRMVDLESATDPQRSTFAEWWEKTQRALRYLTSPIPELPLTGERAQKTALFRRGYRLFSVENDHVQKQAAEKVKKVLEPLTKLGRDPQDNSALRQYFKLGEALQRAKMDDARTKEIRAKMAELEPRLNKDPFNLFRRLVLYRDLWWRGTYLKTEDGKPITLPMGLTVDEVRAELRRLTDAISNHKDGLAITEALRRHYALTDELQKSILAHGEIIPESLRNPLYFPHHIIDSWNGSVARVKPTTEEDFRKYLINPVGSGKLIQSDYLKAMYLHTADVLAHNARVDLVEKYWKPYDISEKLKAQHGEAWDKPWNLPPGYKLFTPYNKLPLRMDYILSREVLADKLGVLFNDGDLRERMGETGKVLKVSPDDLHAALVAGEKIKWALPEEIADALNGIAKREAAEANPGLGNTLGAPFRKLNSFWKGTKLFAPWNWIRYEYGNLSTDAIDKVLAADPGAAKYLSRAAREVWNSGDQGFKASPEFAAAQREGVFDTVTAGEAGALLELPAFKEFLTPGEKKLATIKAIMGGPARGSKFREATFRYANFLANVERLRAGKEPVYAGAFHGDIKALGDEVSGQRRMLEGEELNYAKAAEISLKTFGDYNSLGVASQWLRKYAVPFWSWQDVNFRYHANQLRNLADGLMGKNGDITAAEKAVLRYAGARTIATLIAVGIAKEIWNQFGGPAMGLWKDDDDLESKLSAEDRRRGHIIIGKDDKGQPMVVYTPSAWSDVAEWVGGQNMKRLFMEYARGQITLDQVAKDYAKQLPRDVLNKLFGSMGPLIKGPYELMSGMATFPDVTDQRRIPESERWWRLVSTFTDDRMVNSIRAGFDKDYYNQPALEQLQQIILQVRRRDPEQWAYYEAREDASDWKEKKTGKRHEGGAYDAPEAQALRNFRKAIYRGDVGNAERFYSRLLEYGYTAERLDSTIRSQHPLADLNEMERKEYAKGLSVKQRQELELAMKYYSRIKAMDGREKQLFPQKGFKARPNPELLRRIVEKR